MEINWQLVIAIAGFIVIFILRRFLRAFFPVLFALLVLIPLLFYFYRQYKYRDLWSVVPEYEKLISALKRMRLNSYCKLINVSMSNLLLARDRAEKFKDFLLSESSLQIKTRILQLKKEIQNEINKDKLEFLKKSLKDAEDAYQHIQEIEKFIQRYETSKEILANHFRNVRLKLEIDEMKFMQSFNYRNDEVDRIMDEIKSFDRMFDSFESNKPYGNTEKIENFEKNNDFENLNFSPTSENSFQNLNVVNNPNNENLNEKINN